MAPDPAPPPIILAIPAPSPPPNPSSLTLNSDPPPPTSDLSSSPPDPACPSPVPAHPPPVFPVSAPASSAPASQEQCEDQVRQKLPADLLCFLSFLPPSSSVETPPNQRFSAAPEPPPAAPAAPEVRPPSSGFPPLPSSSSNRAADAPLPAHPADLRFRPKPARQNASATTVTEPPPAVSPETAAPPPPLSSSLLKRPHHADAPFPAQPADPQLRSQPVRRNAQANPLHPKSYAQAAKGSPGPGFVRAHARDVDSFARLPRTGINIICGSHEGIPACSIVQSDLPKVEGLYAKALVMNFHGGRPSLAASHKEFSNWGFEGSFSIGPLTSKSFLLRFQEERDLLKILTRPSSTLLTFPYKVFRWHNRLHIKEESCLVPIWISLPRLPTQCFAPEFLESFASLIGRFLCLDKATATLARPSEARMCIELDLRKERPQFIWIGLFEGFKQPIVYERVPKFCIGCQVQGHTNVECSKNTLDTLQSKDSGTIPANQERSQAVRRNAKEISAAVSQENPHQSRASSVAASVAPLLASDTPQQDPPDPSQQQRHPPQINPVVLSLEQQHIAAEPFASFPLPQSPSHQAPPAAAPHLPAPHHQSILDVATQQPLPPLPSNAKAFSSPCPAAAVPPIAQEPGPAAAVPLPAAAVPHLDSDPHLQAPHPPLQQSGVYEALLQSPISGHAVPHLAAAGPAAGPAAAVPPIAQEPGPAAAVPYLAAAVPQLAAAVPHLDTDPHRQSPHPPLQQSGVSEALHPPSPHSSSNAKAPLFPAAAESPVTPNPQNVTQTGQAFAAAPTPVLSAQAAPFSPSDPVQSVQQTSALNNQHSTSSLRVYYNKNGAKYITALPQPGRPWEMVNCQLGNQGHLSSIINAPSLSYNHHQIHALEGYDSEGSFETDSQPNSPLESPKEDANKCSFLPQSCASEGEQPTEDHPGFQGHISDVEFYHRPMSSKKNKRQPDGPLRVQLRTRKGPSGHK